MTRPIVVIEDLHKNFGALEVLRGINLKLGLGGKVAIIGPSGSGKSTLLRCTNYLEVPSRGHIYLDGELFGEKLVNGQYTRMSEKDLAGQPKPAGMIFQTFYLSPPLPPRQ